MRTLMALAFTVATTFSALAPAHAESIGEAVRRFRESAQFDRARAGEFNKLANEDQGVAQSRERQAQDLDNNAIKYSERGTWHRQVAAQYGNNPDQLRLAKECDDMATSLHNMAIERRNMVRSLQAHVISWRTWAQNMERRAQAAEATAQRLQTAGSL